MMGLAGPVAVAAHDAGAANILLAWIAAEGVENVRPTMAGPAAKLWAARFPTVPLLGLAEALADSQTLLSGTGWESSFEHDARKAALALGIRSVAVIDHWVNYRQRFVRGIEEMLPEEIWVTDAYAVAEAQRAIPGVLVREQPNLYLAEQAHAAGPRPDQGDLLFVSEPARSNWGGAMEGEFQALEFLVEMRHAAGIDGNAPLRIRPHPSEPQGKYDSWIASHPGSRLDASTDVAQALVSARWVAGLQSFALVIALEAGRPTISALPTGAPECKLPHAGIIHLRDLAPPTTR